MPPGAAPGQNTTPPAPPPVTAEPVPSPPHPAGGPRFFATSSFWNTPLATNTPLDPSSPLLVSELRAMVNKEITGKWGPYISTTGYSTPIYTVGEHQPGVYVKEENPNPSPTLQSALSNVPIPPGARPAAGSDAQLSIWQPSMDRLWELWGASLASDGWHAKWGGAIEHVSKSPGYFTPSSWTGAQYNWGAAATSLPLVGGLITLEDLQRGRIDHAVAISLPSTRAGVWSWPAQRSDGNAPSLTAVPEGARFRLDPTLNLAALSMAPLARMIALAAQRYGIVVRDTSGVVDFYGEDPTPTATDPWKAAFAGQPVWQILSQIPWSYLQALVLTPCSKQPCATPPGTP